MRIQERPRRDPACVAHQRTPCARHGVCANATRSTVVLIFLQVVSLLELDLRELGELAAAQLHHLVPQRLGQAWSGLGLGLGLG